MRTIRFCTFETNSSSTHAMCMCSVENYNKFLKKELFLEYETLHTLQELYDELVKQCTLDPTNYYKDFFETGLCGKVPTIQTFQQVIMDESYWDYVDYEADREKFDTEDEWIIANIRSYFAEHNIGNVHNFNMRYGEWHDKFSDQFNGVVAFGHYGRG